MAHTVLRCNDFMQNLLFSAATIAEGELYSTEIAGGKLASVDVRDIVALVERTVSPIACHIAGRRSSESRGTIGLRSPGTLVLRQEYLRSNGPIQ